MLLVSVIWGLFFSCITALLAYQKQSLSDSGMLGAIIVGTVIYAFGSLYWFGLLLAFFISSSLLSHYQKSRKGMVEDVFAKTGRRDGSQVLANGGLGAVLAIIAYLAEDPVPWMVMYLGVIATVNADTWATEFGVLSKAPPRHVLTWERVEKGKSGGISFLGTSASLAGALFIGGWATIFLIMAGFPFTWGWLLIAGLAGFAGAWADSLLGATVQMMYRCSLCHKETEKNVHCGRKTVPCRGWRWFSNDLVNLASSMVGGSVALILWNIL